MSGWQVDENGRRYRVVGNGCLEYAGTIETTRGVIDEDAPKRPAVWHDYNSGHEIHRSPQAAQSSGTICPLKAFKGGMYRFCDGGCAFYDAGGCSFSGRTTAALQDTRGKDCPIVGQCTAECALYHDGCDLRR